MAPNEEDKAAWIATGFDRNGFGFNKVPFIGVGALTALIGLSLAPTSLPAVLFSFTVATVLPIVTAAVAATFLVATGIYMYTNRNRQIDNQFKLEFDKEPASNDELYFADEDLILVEQLDNDLNSPTPHANISSQAQREPQHFPSLFSRTTQKRTDIALKKDEEYLHYTSLQ